MTIWYPQNHRKSTINTDKIVASPIKLLLLRSSERTLAEVFLVKDLRVTTGVGDPHYRLGSYR